MYEKLNKSRDSLLKEELTENLFREFENQVKKSKTFNSEKFGKYSIIDMIHKSVENGIENVVTHIINTYPSLVGTKQVKIMAKLFEKFFEDSNFGNFEYTQKTGKNIFRVEHTIGINGNEFLKKLFERIFEICLKNYSFHIISNKNYVSIIFR